jgi:hypothetical protein
VCSGDFLSKILESTWATEESWETCSVRPDSAWSPRVILAVAADEDQSLGAHPAQFRKAKRVIRIRRALVRDTPKEALICINSPRETVCRRLPNKRDRRVRIYHFTGCGGRRMPAKLTFVGLRSIAQQNLLIASYGTEHLARHQRGIALTISAAVTIHPHVQGLER